jgi:hypothetical protein
MIELKEKKREKKRRREVHSMKAPPSTNDDNRELFYIHLSLLSKYSLRLEF